jgi:hypothetical protein
MLFLIRLKMLFDPSLKHSERMKGAERLDRMLSERERGIVRFSQLCFLVNIDQEITENDAERIVQALDKGFNGDRCRCFQRIRLSLRSFEKL